MPRVEEGQTLTVEWASVGIPSDATMTITLIDYNFWFWEADDTDHVLATSSANTGSASIQIPNTGVSVENIWRAEFQDFESWDIGFGHPWSGN